MTILINLFGASSAGKSTLMADLFTSLKQHGYTVEMCPEIIKKWFWDGVKPNQFDQFYLMGAEIKQQVRLFDKVDFILSDSPVLQNAFYNWYLYHDDIMLYEAEIYITKAIEHGINFYNFNVIRNVPYETSGRYQTESESDEIARKMIAYLEERGYYFPVVQGQWHERVNYILEYINKHALVIK